MNSIWPTAQGALDRDNVPETHRGATLSTSCRNNAEWERIQPPP